MTASPLALPTSRRRARRLLATDAAIWTLVAAALVIFLLQMASVGELDPALWIPLADPAIQAFLWGGLLGTIGAGATAIAIALVAGIVIAAARLSSRRWLSGIAATVSEICRALPILFVVYLLLMVAPTWGLRMPPFWQIVVAIAIHGAGAFAELFRAGMLALPRGQSEAAASLGMTDLQALRLVVMPQVVRALLPAVIGQCVQILKETSLGYVVSYPELLRRGQLLAEHMGGGFLQAYAEVAVLFIGLNLLLTGVAVWLERRWNSRTSIHASPGSSARLRDRA